MYIFSSILPNCNRLLLNKMYVLHYTANLTVMARSQIKNHTNKSLNLFDYLQDKL